MDGRSLDLNALILEIHSASLQPDAWPAVVEHVRNLLCGNSPLLHATASKTADEYWYVGAQIDPEMGPQYAGHWADEDRQDFQWLAPHLTLAAQNFWLARGLAARGATLASALDVLTIPVLGVDRTTCVVFMNATAERMLRVACWLRVRQGSLAIGLGVNEGKKFNEAIRWLHRGRGMSTLLSDRASGQTAVMTTTPVTTDSVDSLSRTSAIGLVWLVATQPDITSVAQFARLFELTPAEERLLKELAAGEDLLEASRQLEISIHTARNQLKAIFRKTGRRTQGQLLALVNRLNAIQTDKITEMALG